MAVQYTLTNSHEQTPDEDIFFPARYLDVGRITFAKADDPGFIINIEIKIGVAAQINGNGLIQC